MAAAKCNRVETAEAGRFTKALRENAHATKGASFDSVSSAALDFAVTSLNQSETTVAKMPHELQVVLDEAQDDVEKKAVLNALMDGCSEYEAAHGTAIPDDLVAQALHNAYSTTREAKTILDSVADNNHSANNSLQPNRAVISIVSTLAETCPWALYLPADIGSNEAKLAILTHRANSKFGSYAVNDPMDGVDCGNPFISSSRINTSKPSAEAGKEGQIAGKITAIQTDENTCDPQAGDLKLLRGRTVVYVQGRVAASEAPNAAGTGASPISGTINLAGTEYAIAGTINTDTGEYTLTSTPALPAEVEVAVEGFIDFERDPTLTPGIMTQVQTYALYAKPWRCHTYLSMDSRTQMANELGLDPLSESLVQINTQFALERHYQAIAMGKRLASNNQTEFDFSKAMAHQDSARNEVWRDFAYPLGLVDQRMANATINHGVTHLYVGERIMAQLTGLPTTFFQPSGLTARPSIYRVGRLFGRFEVYYTPKLLKETETSSQILCVGRATDVARNPVVFGDAVAPVTLPLAVNADLRQGVGYYARNFTAVNPHAESANGFALINVINM